MSIKVLYVDDESPNLLLFKLSFRNVLDVYTALSAEEALQLLDSNPNIEIVVSDMRMPKMNGLDFIKEARKKRNNIPYCLLTGFDENDEINAALDNKLIDYFIRKPFKREEVLEIVNSALS